MGSRALTRDPSLVPGLASAGQQGGGLGGGAARPGAQGRAAGSPSAPGLCPLTTGAEDYQLNSECNSDVVCPHKCRCEASMVECSSLKLTKIPERVPQATAEL